MVLSGKLFVTIYVPHKQMHLRQIQHSLAVGMVRSTLMTHSVLVMRVNSSNVRPQPWGCTTVHTWRMQALCAGVSVSVWVWNRTRENWLVYCELLYVSSSYPLSEWYSTTGGRGQQLQWKGGGVCEWGVGYGVWRLLHSGGCNGSLQQSGISVNRCVANLVQF